MRMEFIFDRGQNPGSTSQQKQEYQQLVEYFLVALGVENNQIWVNLSPYEKNRIIPDPISRTAFGETLLAQDYILKQLSASLTNPDESPGKEYWQRIFSQAKEQLGTTNVPVNGFNKVWIVPDKADVYQKGNTAWVLYSHFKVMMDEDYLAMQKRGHINVSPFPQKIAKQAMQELILPVLEQQVNEGAHFAPLRQIMNSLILATWYKKTLKTSVLGSKYNGKNKLAGLTALEQSAKQHIYKQYLEAYKKGVFNYIREESTTTTPRKYFSGGITSLNPTDMATVSTLNALSSHDRAMANEMWKQINTRGLDQAAVMFSPSSPVDMAMRAAQARKTGKDFGLSGHEEELFDQTVQTAAYDVAKIQEQIGLFEKFDTVSPGSYVHLIPALKQFVAQAPVVVPNVDSSHLKTEIEQVDSRIQKIQDQIKSLAANIKYARLGDAQGMGQLARLMYEKHNNSQVQMRSGIKFVLPYQYSDEETRYISVGEENGEIYEYAFRGGQWVAMNNGLVNAILSIFGGKDVAAEDFEIKQIFPYESFGGEKRYVLIAYQRVFGKGMVIPRIYEFGIRNDQWQRIAPGFKDRLNLTDKTNREGLAAALRWYSYTRRSIINQVVPVDLSSGRHYLALGNKGKEAAFYAVEDKWKTFKVKTSYGNDDIKSIFEYKQYLEQRYISIAKSGKIFEQNKEKRLEGDQEGLAKVIRQAHGEHKVNYIFSYYWYKNNLESEERFVSAGENGLAFEYALRNINGQWEQIPPGEESLSKVIRADAQLANLNSVLRYDTEDSKSGFIITGSKPGRLKSSPVLSKEEPLAYAYEPQEFFDERLDVLKEELLDEEIKKLNLILQYLRNQPLTATIEARLSSREKQLSNYNKIKALRKKLSSPPETVVSSLNMKMLQLQQSILDTYQSIIHSTRSFIPAIRLYPYKYNGEQRLVTTLSIASELNVREFAFRDGQWMVINEGGNSPLIANAHLNISKAGLVEHFFSYHINGETRKVTIGTGYNEISEQAGEEILVKAMKQQNWGIDIPNAKKTWADIASIDQDGHVYFLVSALYPASILQEKPIFFSFAQVKDESPEALQQRQDDRETLAALESLYDAAMNTPGSGLSEIEQILYDQTIGASQGDVTKIEDQIAIFGEMETHSPGLYLHLIATLKKYVADARTHHPQIDTSTLQGQLAAVEKKIDDLQSKQSEIQKSFPGQYFVRVEDTQGMGQLAHLMRMKNENRIKFIFDYPDPHNPHLKRYISVSEDNKMSEFIFRPGPDRWGGLVLDEEGLSKAILQAYAGRNIEIRQIFPHESYDKETRYLVIGYQHMNFAGKKLLIPRIYEFALREGRWQRVRPEGIAKTLRWAFMSMQAYQVFPFYHVVPRLLVVGKGYPREYVLGSGDYPILKTMPAGNFVTIFTKNLNAAHQGQEIKFVFEYKDPPADKQLRFISIGTDGQMHEYNWEGVLKQPHEEHLVKTIRNAPHGFGKVIFIFSYRLNGEQRYVSLAEDKTTHEYAFRNGQWEVIQLDEKRFANELSKLNTSFVLPYQTKDLREGFLAVGSSLDEYPPVSAYEPVAENQPTSMLLKQELQDLQAEKMRLELAILQADLKTAPVSQKTLLETHEQWLEGQLAIYNEIKGLRQKLKSPPETVVPLPENHSAVQLAELLLERQRGVGALLPYKLNGEQRLVAINHDTGHAPHEYALREGHWVLLGVGEGILAKLISSLGNKVHWSFYTYELDGEEYFMARSEELDVKKFVLRSGEWEDLKSGEDGNDFYKSIIQRLSRGVDGLKELMAKVYRISTINIFSYYINGEERVVLVGDRHNDVFEFAIRDGKWRQLSPEEEILAKALKEQVWVNRPSTSEILSSESKKWFSVVPFILDGQTVFLASGEENFTSSYYENSIFAFGQVNDNSPEALQQRQLDKETLVHLEKVFANERLYELTLEKAKLEEQIEVLSQQPGISQEVLKELRPTEGLGQLFSSLTNDEKTNLRFPFFYELNGEQHFVGLHQYSAFEYVLRNGTWIPLPQGEPSLAQRITKSHGGNHISSIFTYDFMGEQRFVSVGAKGKAYEYAFRGGRWLVLNGILDKALKQVRKAISTVTQVPALTLAELVQNAYGNEDIMHIFPYELFKDQQRVITAGGNGRVFEFIYDKDEWNTTAGGVAVVKRGGWVLRSRSMANLAHWLTEFHEGAIMKNLITVPRANVQSHLGSIDSNGKVHEFIYSNAKAEWETADTSSTQLVGLKNKYGKSLNVFAYELNAQHYLHVVGENGVTAEYIWRPGNTQLHYEPLPTDKEQLLKITRQKKIIQWFDVKLGEDEFYLGMKGGFEGFLAYAKVQENPELQSLHHQLELINQELSHDAAMSTQAKDYSRLPFQEQVQAYFSLKKSMIEALDQNRFDDFKKLYGQMTGLVEFLSPAVIKTDDQHLRQVLLPILNKPLGDNELPLFRLELESAGMKDFPPQMKQRIDVIIKEMANDIAHDALEASRLIKQFQEVIVPARITNRIPTEIFNEDPHLWKEAVRDSLLELHAWGGYLPFTDHLILSHIKDELILRSTIKHELIHYMAAKGIIRIPYEWENITYAVDVIERVRHAGLTLTEGELMLGEFYDFGEPALQQLYFKGKEMGIKGDLGFIVNPGVSDRKAGYFSIDYLMMVAREVYEANGIPTQSLLDPYSAQRAAGILLGGIIMGLQHNDPNIKPLVLLRRFFDVLADRFIDPMLNPETAAMILDLEKDTIAYAKAASGSTNLKPNPLKTGIPSYEPGSPPIFNYLITSLFPRSYEGTDSNDKVGQMEMARHRADAQVFMTLAQHRDGLRVLMNDLPETLRNDPSLPPLWDILLLTKAIGIRAETNIGQIRDGIVDPRYQGVRQWVMEELVDRYHMGDPLIEQAVFQGLPLHRKYLDSLLKRRVFYDKQKNEEEQFVDDRVKIPELQKAIVDTAGSLDDANHYGWAKLMYDYKSLSEPQILQIIERIWPVYHQLYEKAFEEELRWKTYEAKMRQEKKEIIRQVYEQIKEQIKQELMEYFQNLPQPMQEAIQKAVEDKMNQTSMDMSDSGMPQGMSMPMPGQSQSGQGQQGQSQPGQDQQGKSFGSGQGSMQVSLEQMEDHINALENQINGLMGKLEEVKNQASNLTPSQGKTPEGLEGLKEGVNELQQAGQGVLNDARDIAKGAADQKKNMQGAAHQLPVPELAQPSQEAAGQLDQEAQGMGQKAQQLMDKINDLSKKADYLSQQLQQPGMQENQINAQVDGIQQGLTGVKQSIDQTQGGTREASKALHQLKEKVESLQNIMNQFEQGKPSAEQSGKTNPSPQGQTQGQAQPASETGPPSELEIPPLKLPPMPSLVEILGGSKIETAQSHVRPAKLKAFDERQRLKEEEERLNKETDMTSEERAELDSWYDIEIKQGDKTLTVKQMIAALTKMLRVLTLPENELTLKTGEEEGQLVLDIVSVIMGGAGYASWQVSEPVPVKISLLLDNSGSMGFDIPGQTLKPIEIARLVTFIFVNALLNHNDERRKLGFKPIEFEIGFFEEKGDLLFSHNTIFKMKGGQRIHRKKLLYEFWHSFTAKGGTYFAQNLKYFTQRLISAKERTDEKSVRVMFPFTDEDVTDSQKSEVLGAIQNATKANARIFIVPVGNRNLIANTLALHKDHPEQVIHPPSFTDLPMAITKALFGEIIRQGKSASLLKNMAMTSQDIKTTAYKNFTIQNIDGRSWLVFKRGNMERKWERGMGGPYVPRIEVPDTESNQDRIVSIIDALYKPDEIYSSYSTDGKWFIREIHDRQLEVVAQEDDGQWKVIHTFDQTPLNTQALSFNFDEANHQLSVNQGNTRYLPVVGVTIDDFNQWQTYEYAHDGLMLYHPQEGRVVILVKTNDQWQKNYDLSLEQFGRVQDVGNGKALSIMGEPGLGKDENVLAAAYLMNQEVFAIGAHGDMIVDEMVKGFKSYGEKKAGTSGVVPSGLNEGMHRGAWYVIREGNALPMPVTNALKALISGKRHFWPVERDGVEGFETTVNHPRARLITTSNILRTGITGHSLVENAPMLQRFKELYFHWNRPDDEVIDQRTYALKMAQEKGILTQQVRDHINESVTNLVAAARKLRLSFVGYDAVQEGYINRDWNLLDLKYLGSKMRRDAQLAKVFKDGPKNEPGEQLKRAISPRVIRNILKHYLTFPKDWDNRALSVIRLYYNFDAEEDPDNTYQWVLRDLANEGIKDTNQAPPQLDASSFKVQGDKLLITPKNNDVWDSLEVPLHPEASIRLYGQLPAEVVKWLSFGPANQLKFYRFLQAHQMGRNAIFVGNPGSGKSTMADAIQKLLNKPGDVIFPVNEHTLYTELLFSREFKDSRSQFKPGFLPNAMNDHGVGQVALFEETNQGRLAVIKALNEVAERGELQDLRLESQVLKAAPGWGAIHAINKPGSATRLKSFTDDFLDRHIIINFESMPVKDMKVLLQQAGSSHDRKSQVNPQLIGEPTTEMYTDGLFKGEAKYTGIIGVYQELNRKLLEDPTILPPSRDLGVRELQRYMEDLVNLYPYYEENEIYQENKEGAQKNSFRSQDNLYKLFMEAFTLPQEDQTEFLKWDASIFQIFEAQNLVSKSDPDVLVKNYQDVIVSPLEPLEKPQTGDAYLDQVLTSLQVNIIPASAARNIKILQDMSLDLLKVLGQHNDYRFTEEQFSSASLQPENLVSALSIPGTERAIDKLNKELEKVDLYKSLNGRTKEINDLIKKHEEGGKIDVIELNRRLMEKKFESLTPKNSVKEQKELPVALRIQNLNRVKTIVYFLKLVYDKRGQGAPAGQRHTVENLQKIEDVLGNVDTVLVRKEWPLEVLDLEGDLSTHPLIAETLPKLPTGPSWNNDLCEIIIRNLVSRHFKKTDNAQSSELVKLSESDQELLDRTLVEAKGDAAKIRDFIKTLQETGLNPDVIPYLEAKLVELANKPADIPHETNIESPSVRPLEPQIIIGENKLTIKRDHDLSEFDIKVSAIKGKTIYDWNGYPTHIYLLQTGFEPADPGETTDKTWFRVLFVGQKVLISRSFAISEYGLTIEGDLHVEETKEGAFSVSIPVRHEVWNVDSSGNLWDTGEISTIPYLTGFYKGNLTGPKTSNADKAMLPKLSETDQSLLDPALKETNDDPAKIEVFIENLHDAQPDSNVIVHLEERIKWLAEQARLKQERAEEEARRKQREADEETRRKQQEAQEERTRIETAKANSQPITVGDWGVLVGMMNEKVDWVDYVGVFKDNDGKDIYYVIGKDIIGKRFKDGGLIFDEKLKGYSFAFEKGEWKFLKQILITDNIAKTKHVVVPIGGRKGFLMVSPNKKTEDDIQMVYVYAATKSDHAMAPGGIDLNPDLAQINVHGFSANSEIFDLKKYDYLVINGLIPTIISVTRIAAPNFS